MQHIYQPVMIRTLLESKNTATVEAIARAFLQDDMSQIDYYKQITKNMPGKVLRKNKVVTYHDDKFILNSPNFTDEQRKNLIKICNEKVEKYQEKWGDKIWIHRARSSFSALSRFAAPGWTNSGTSPSWTSSGRLPTAPIRGIIGT